MLDIKFIKEHPDLIRAAAEKKHLDFDVSTLLEVEEERLQHLSTVEQLRHEQNIVSEEIAQTHDQEKKQELITRMRAFKENLREQEEELREVQKRWQDLMLQVPNIPDMSVPDGMGEEDNEVVGEYGEKPTFSFEPKDHITLMEGLDMVDFDRGVKVHGFRGYFLKNAGADLSWALWNYARDFYGTRSFTPVLAPAIVRKEHFYGTGHLPAEADDLYETQDGDRLSGTAEVPLMGLYSDEVLTQEELPKRLLAFSPCYRREAGSYGKDTKGLIRVHEFYKHEQLILCAASHEESVQYFEELNANFEAFIDSLGLPYRRLVICGGDLPAAKVKQYDTEVWVPHQKQYREASSVSYFHDYQTRRFNIRYKDEAGQTRYTHSINSTAVATPRLLVSIVENFQNEDGTVTVPTVLQPYMNTTVITPPSDTDDEANTPES